MFPRDKCIPTYLAHCYRKHYNCLPQGTLTQGTLIHKFEHDLNDLNDENNEGPQG